MLLKHTRYLSTNLEVTEKRCHQLKTHFITAKINIMLMQYFRISYLRWDLRKTEGVKWSGVKQPRIPPFHRHTCPRHDCKLCSYWGTHTTICWCLWQKGMCEDNSRAQRFTTIDNMFILAKYESGYHVTVSANSTFIKASWPVGHTLQHLPFPIDPSLLSPLLHFPPYPIQAIPISI